MHASPAAAAESTSPFPPIRRLRFRFRAIDPIRLPGYSGSAWRGLLGQSLRQTVCVTREPSCDGCLLLSQCVYSTFFESPPKTAEAAERFSAMPHPFVLEPEIGRGRVIEPKQSLTLGINLIGPAAGLIPYLIHALERAGQRGLGRDGGRFALDDLALESGLGSDQWLRLYSARDRQLKPLDSQAGEDLPTLPMRPSSVRLHLQTPLRIKHHGRFIGPRHLTAADLLRNLIMRMAMLCELYAPQRGGLDTNALFAAIPAVQMSDAQLRWHDWTRYSSRQRTSMQMGGLLGQLTLSGDGLEPFWHLLHLGQWTHIGKGTSFGLGRYRLV
jgi:hypothetical protein